MCRIRLVTSILTCAAISGAILLLAGPRPAALAQQAPTTEPSTPPQTQPQPEQVLQELLMEPPTNAPIAPTIPGMPAEAPPGPSAEEAPGGGRLLPDGYIIAKRTGRLVQQGQWWLFAFEADGKPMQDPPMRMLPCRWLEHMEAASAGGTRSVLFIVTGRVTAYHGANYLLPENVLIVHDLGNFQ
jgi:hypothetical protein